MTTSPDRWATVERLYHAAMARPVDGRTAFLAEACAGDDELRREVESLLAQNASADEVLSRGAAGAAAELLSDVGQSVLTGRIGAYQILAPIGAGGMGEVYRARDTRLGREVAIKMLPRAFTADPDRRARFEREARLLAALNHPNIATIHGIEEDAAGHSAIVMELVDGETLAERLARCARGLSLKETLTIATQIADALDAAHEKGVVHRDLKPANIAITSAHGVKVLDFGLAKTVAGDDTLTTAAPTIDATREGVLMGTPAYMSPEQARGQRVDKRTDIWAFGCVVYEMLTGKPPFQGATVSDTVAVILQHEPDWRRLPASTPANVRRVLQRCLEKDTGLRCRDIADARADLSAPPASTADRGGRHLPSRSIGFAAAVLGVGLVAGATGWWVRSYVAPSDDPPVLRADLIPPAGTEFEVGFGFGALSPDGTRAVLVGHTAAGEKLFIRTLASGVVRELAGTEGAQLPFWSPDGASVGFFASGKLQRVDLRGGTPVIIANAPSGGRGGSWNADGVIIYNAVNDGPLLRVDAAGGTVTPLTHVDTTQTENSHRLPVFLADGRHFVFFVRADDRTKQGIYVSSLDDPGKKVLLVRSAFAGTSVSIRNAGEYLMWLRDGAIVAQRLDVAQQRLVGEPRTLVDGIEGTANAPSPISASADGKLLYGSRPVAQYQVTVYSRTGQPLDVIGTPERYTMLALSPDGQRLALSRDEASGTSDVWVLETSRGIPTRVTSSHQVVQVGTWSPDGQWVMFNAGAPPNLFIAPASGVGDERRLSTSRSAEALADWSPDGRSIIFAETANDPTSATRTNLQVLQIDQQRVTPYLVTQNGETHGRFSPDAHWIAYVSDESGRDELYVQSFPIGRGKWRVSTDGAAAPRWRRDGRELFFVGPDRSVMAVAVQASSDALHFDRPRTLFRLSAASAFDATSGTLQTRSSVPWDVFPDGTRFIALATASSAEQTVMSLIVNWPAIGQ